MFCSRRLNEWYEVRSLSKTKTLYLSLSDKGFDYQKASFNDVDASAIRFADHLISTQNVRKGDRVVLLFPPGESIEFIKCFVGCVYAGLVVVPVSPPHPGPNFKHTMQNVLRIIEDSGAKLVVSTSLVVQMIKGHLLFHRDLKLPKDLRLNSFDSESIKSTSELSQAAEFTPKEDDIIVLQYSSGSTGNPKGIMLTHKNIFSNCMKNAEFIGIDTNTVALSWLPMFHDMGLMSSLFNPILNGPGLQLLLDPLAFLKNPLIWIEIINQRRVSVSGGPNFAYGVLSKKAQDDPSCIKSNMDLSCWKTAFCGAEPIRASTLKDFSDIFCKYGFDGRSFCPLYGLGESTLMVSHPNMQLRNQITVLKISRKKLSQGIVELCDDSEDCIEVIGLGSVDPSTTLRVVDPSTKKPLPDRKVGEFWLSSDSVAKGYFNRKEYSKEIFGAMTSEGEGPFLRTGDLGFLHNGELFFTSRLKDIVVINGVKYIPQDIEQVLEESISSLRKGRCVAFAVDTKEGEVVGLVAEIKKGLKIDAKQENEIIENIQATLFKSFAIPVNSKFIKLIPAGTLPKTTSGKVQRHECKNRLLNGTLEDVKKIKSSSTMQLVMKTLMIWLLGYFIYIYERFTTKKSDIKPSEKKTTRVEVVKEVEKEKSQMTEEEKAKQKMDIQNIITDYLKKNLQLEEISTKTPFFEYGLKSSDAVFMVGQLEKIFYNKRIPPTILYEYYTIDALSSYLVSDSFLNQTLEQINYQDFRSLQQSLHTGIYRQQALILGIATAVPEYGYTQKKIMEDMLECSPKLKNSDNVSKFVKLFETSSIKTRHLSVPPKELVHLESTEQRNQSYVQNAPKLSLRAAEKAIEDWGGNKMDITHVLTVSCTGTIVPGLEFQLVDDLDLDRNVMRLGINFMGCFGGLAGLRTAQSIALSNPRNRVLLVCTELCSLQVQKDDLRVDNFVASSLFADGAAAVIIGGSAKSSEHHYFEIVKANCYALKNSKDKIKWDLSDHGWICGLEPDIAYLIGQYILPFTNSLVTDGKSEGDVKFADLDWCIHPGGKSIIELIEDKLQISKDHTSSTWRTYENYGNMSSATVLFVLEDMKKQQIQKNHNELRETIAGLAFGPGLAIEGILLKRNISV